MAQENGKHRYLQVIQHTKNLPKPPAGFKWAVNPDFTDEFEGDQLDAEKWYNESPYWKNGRPPATFKAYSVSVENGCLRIKNSRLNPTEGNDGKPGTKYSYAEGRFRTGRFPRHRCLRTVNSHRIRQAALR